MFFATKGESTRMQEKLSIVTISYSDFDGLKKTFDSLTPLLESVDLSWEHIVVDQSPDQNEALFRVLPKKWPIFRITSAPLGIYGAMNLGIQKSCGSLIWLLNGGDLLYSIDALRTLLQLFKDRDLDVLFAGARLTRAGQYIYPRYPKSNLLKSLLGKNHICHQGAIYRRRVFEEIGPFSLDYKIASDYDHHWRCYVNERRTLCLSILLADFDMSGVSSNWFQSLREFKCIEAVYESKLPVWAHALHRIALSIEFGRFAFFFCLSQLPGAAILRKTWYASQKLRYAKATSASP